MYIYHFEIHTQYWGESKWKPRLAMVREGDRLAVGQDTETIFTLEAVEGDAVRLVPVGKGPAQINSDRTINLLAPFPPTTLLVGETVKMSSRSIDGGNYWKVTLFAITQERVETDQQ